MKATLIRAAVFGAGILFIALGNHLGAVWPVVIGACLLLWCLNTS